MRIGIVGSGIAGLTAAWLFQKSGHDVTIFEKQARLGLDGHAIHIERDRQRVRGDVPSRMFKATQWPNLVQIYKQIGVESTPVSVSQSLSYENGECYLSFQNSFGLRLNPSQLLKSSVRQLVREAQSFQADGERALTELDPSITLADYLHRGGYTSRFINDLLYPTLASTVCTCSYRALDNYPAVIILETLRKLGDSQPLLRTAFGTGDVAQRLSAGVHDIRLQTNVDSVQQIDDVVQVRWARNSSESEMAMFDHVILAVEAPAAASILSPCSADEKKMLASFAYESIEVIVHTDTTLMPSDRSAWATFNMISRSGDDRGKGRAAMCTVWMNRFHTEWNWDHSVFQTIGPLGDADPTSVLGRARLSRPVIDQNSVEGWNLLNGLHAQPERRVWFCGSYASQGVPLLETGVVSALHVGQVLGIPGGAFDPVPVIRK